MFLFTSLSVPAVAETVYGKVTCSELTVRKSNSTSAEKIGTLSEGDVIEVVKIKDGWAKIKSGKNTGFVASEYLVKCTKDGKTADDSAKEVSLKGSYGKATARTRVYKSASTSSTRIGTLQKGDVVEMIASCNGWYKIKSSSGEVGYCETGTLTKTSKPKASSSSSSTLKSLKYGDSGSLVEKMQKRLYELGYLGKSSVTGKFNTATSKAVKKFKLFNGYAVNATADVTMQKKLYSSSANKCKKVVSWDWFDCKIGSIFKRHGGLAYIIDVETGAKINIRRVGGTKHADVEPKTASDTAKLKKLYGGTWSWKCRAVILVVDGNYIAASINGMPHGDQISTSNNFDGQFCLHLENSTTHGTEKENPNQQSCVKKAYKWLS